jgi:predicted RNA-binding protein
MKVLHRIVPILVLATPLIGVVGCMENIALIGRPTIAEGESDVRGAIERVDFSSRRIYLRPNDSDRRVVAYSADAKVLYRGREYPLTRLETGDVVALQVKRDSRGDSYTDLIRVQENVREQSRTERPSAAAQIQTLAGRVNRIDLRGNSFDLDDQQSQPVLVVLSESARDSDRERLRRLKDGDRVRIEGRFMGRDRFELLSFLNEES